jgi:hypothetical protein
MKEKVELQRVREFGDILSDSILFLRQNFVPLLKCYVVICGFFLVANAAVEIEGKLSDLDAFDQQQSVFTGSYWLSLLFNLVSSSAVTITTFSYIALYKAKGNQAPEVREVWGYFRYFFFRIFFSNLLIAVCVVIGFFLCIIPGIYMIPLAALLIPVMIMENASLSYALDQARKLIKENWWFVFGTLLIVALIIASAMAMVILPGVILTGGAEWITGLRSNSTEIIVMAITTNVAHVFYLFPYIAIALLYFSLADQKQGTSLIDRIQMLGKTSAGSEESSEQY